MGKKKKLLQSYTPSLDSQSVPKRLQSYTSLLGSQLQSVLELAKK